MDAGGSHVTAALGIDSWVPVARATGPPVNISSVELELAVSRILEVLEAVTARAQSTGKPDMLVIGAAGASNRKRGALIREMLRARSSARRVHLTTDFDIAVEDALGERPGILLIAGTGSVACARLEDGELVRAGGHGWRFGDEGSGYYIGTQAVRRILRALDHRSPATLMTNHALEQTGFGNVDRFIRWARDAEPYEIADLSRAVFLAAEQQDAQALEIVDRSATELFQLVVALSSRFSAPLEAKPGICFHGGILRPGSPVREELERRIPELEGFSLSQQEVDPARGALRLAHRLSGGR